MKRILLLLYFLPLLAKSQNIFTVSNIPGVTADYHSLQGALDSVANGSTLLIFPSTVSYGSVTIRKKLAIYGNGFLLDQNGPPATHPNTYGVNIDTMKIQAGGSNSYIEGLQFNSYAFPHNNTTPFRIDSASNIIVSRCAFFPSYLGTFVTTNATYNCVFRNCYFDLRESGEGNVSWVLNDLNSGSSALQFRNNLITDRRGGGFFTCGNVLVNSDISFINNTIIAILGASSFQNLRYINNIFVNSNPSYVVNNTNVLMKGVAHHNITDTPNLFDTTTYNYRNAIADSLFVYSQFGFYSEDAQWMLRNNSFAATYGVDSTQCGMYGGDYPYTLSGIPNLPNIYKLTITNDSSIRGHVLVRVQGKASN